VATHVGGVLEHQHVARGRSPAEIRQAVEESVPVAAEPCRELECRCRAFEECRLVAAAVEIDAHGIETQRRCKSLQSSNRLRRHVDDLHGGWAGRGLDRLVAHWLSSTRRNER